MEHGFPTAPLASGLRGAGGGAVENPPPQVFTRSQSTYRPGNSVQTSGATSDNRVVTEDEVSIPDSARRRMLLMLSDSVTLLLRLGVPFRMGDNGPPP